nr:MAG: CI repressor helix-turn-helix domain protein [Bacteriophage sp.]
MDSKKLIKQLTLERNLTIPELATKLGYEPQAFRNKINRGTYSLNDFVKILDALDCDIKVVTRDTQKEFS